MFTKLDLQNAFHLVCIREGDEYLVMPFGDAPAVFQGFLNNVLRDSDLLQVAEGPCAACPGSTALPSATFALYKGQEVRDPRVFFLGYMISLGNIQVDPTEISAVLTWPVPDSRKCWSCFLLLPSLCPESQICGSAFHSLLMGEEAL